MKVEESERENLSWKFGEAEKKLYEKRRRPGSLCRVLAEAKRRAQGREIHADALFEAYKLDFDDASRGEKLETITVARKAFEHFSCNSNIRARKQQGNLEKEIVCQNER